MKKTRLSVRRARAVIAEARTTRERNLAVTRAILVMRESESKRSISRNGQYVFRHEAR